MKVKLGVPEDDGDDNKITLPIHEFGKSITAAHGAPTEEVKEFVTKQADEFKRLMSYINDVQWVKEPEFLVGPQVDMLQRYQMVGWHALMASKGYAELREYFTDELRCKKQHIPDTITLKFVIKMAKVWLDRILEEGEQPNRCDCEECND